MNVQEIVRVFSALSIAVMLQTPVVAQPQGQLSPPKVDPPLNVKDGSVVLLKATAKGVQVYSCKATAEDPKKGTWDADHAEPDATLMNEKGDITIHHYLNQEPPGPAWEAKDGSKVIAKKLDPPQKRPVTIPWLLLQAVSHEGNGTLGKVTFIQRVDTEGGVAPAGACTPSARVRVPYRATYYFYGPYK